MSKKGLLGACMLLFWSFCFSAVQPLEINSGIELRILPLGDSITFGFQSTDGNGYRGRLQQDLSGSKLNFIGNVRSGIMADNYNEGHSGATISQIQAYAESILDQDPNIILVHAGTNDINGAPNAQAPYADAPNRLDALIDKLGSACPDAALLVAEIIPAANSGTMSRIATFNSEVANLVEARASRGQHIMSVDMSKLSVDKLADGLHPSDAGYAEMGDMWFKAIQSAADKGWVKAPAKPLSRDVSKGQECLEQPFWYPMLGGADVASGVGSGGNAQFKPVWFPKGEIASGIGLNASGVRFADLDGDGRADYLWVNETTGAVILYLNKGVEDSPFVPVNDAKPIASGLGRRAGVKFADINGDGKDDYLFVEDGGKTTVSINGGQRPDGTWAWGAPTRLAEGVTGGNEDTIMFADLNGDKRADYLIKTSTGGLSMFLNDGHFGSDDFKWVPVGKVAGGLGNPNISVADLNGDGRADYLEWDSEGGLSGYLNVRSKSEGKPVWIPQSGAKSLATGLGASPEWVQLADINGDGKVDYCIIDAKKGSVRLYLNGGTGDTSVIGDGVRFADMNGDGKDDYIALDPDGRAVVYINGGIDNGLKRSWVWLPQNDAKPIATGIGVKRPFVHLADITGDGKADYLGVDEKSGAVTAYTNGGPTADGWLWLPQGKIAGGIGDGAGVRFADVDGDGKADYIWLSEDGAATIYINKIGVNPNDWVPLNDGKPIASGVGGFRKDIRFADINGDGRADYIWVHPLDGSVDVWLNEIGINGANWVPYPKQVAAGVGFSGACITFASMDGSGRADYIPVNPSTGSIAPWLNGCNNVKGIPAGLPPPPSNNGRPGPGSNPNTQRPVTEVTEFSNNASVTVPQDINIPIIGGNVNGSGDVYIDPSIWDDASPTILCEPPCRFILPPFKTSTTITLSDLTTSLTVAWYSDKVLQQVVQSTTIPVPPIATDYIEFYGIDVTSSSIPDTSTYTPTPSVLPPTMIISNDPDPLSRGTKNPPQARTITPPPYPFPTPPSPPPISECPFTQTQILPLDVSALSSTTIISTFSDCSSSSSAIVPPIVLLPKLPPIVIKPGPPGPLCKTGCGHPCRIFCPGPSGCGLYGCAECHNFCSASNCQLITLGIGCGGDDIADPVVQRIKPPGAGDSEPEKKSSSSSSTTSARPNTTVTYDIIEPDYTMPSAEEISRFGAFISSYSSSYSKANGNGASSSSVPAPSTPAPPTSSTPPDNTTPAPPPPPDTTQAPPPPETTDAPPPPETTDAPPPPPPPPKDPIWDTVAPGPLPSQPPTCKVEYGKLKTGPDCTGCGTSAGAADCFKTMQENIDPEAYYATPWYTDCCPKDGDPKKCKTYDVDNKPLFSVTLEKCDGDNDNKTPSLIQGKVMLDAFGKLNDACTPRKKGSLLNREASYGSSKDGIYVFAMGRSQSC